MWVTPQGGAPKWGDPMQVPCLPPFKQTTGWSYHTPITYSIYWVPLWPRVIWKWIQTICSTHYT